MQNKEYNIEQAVKTLSDEVWEIQDKLEKSMILIQEITDEYFLKYDRDKEEDRTFMSWEFPRYRIYSEMIFDYVHAAKSKVDELKQIEIDAHERENYISDSDKTTVESDIIAILEGLTQDNLIMLLAFAKGLQKNKN